MDATTMAIANGLTKRIAEMRKALEILNDAKDPTSFGVRYRFGSGHNDYTYKPLVDSLYLPGSYDTFRSANINYLQNTIAAAEKEFAAL